MQDTISVAEAKTPQLNSSIKNTEAEIVQLTADLKAAQTDREEANSKSC